MATRADDGQNNNGNSNIDNGFKLDSNSGYVPENDAAFSKHLDIAIEAQDGKAPDKDTSTESGEGKTKDTEQQPKPQDKSGDNGDSNAQSKPNKEGKAKEERTTGAKDLKLEDGTVVRGGAERRFYEQREVARQERDHYKTQLSTAQSDLARVQGEMRTLQETVQSTHGLAPQELAIGARIVGDLKRDPVGTTKKLVAELLANGHTVEELGAGVDTLAIQRMLDERMAPLTARDDEPTEEQVAAEAVRETQQFFTNHPDARPHDALLGKVLRDNPTLDLQSAYFQIKSAFAERGYDWSLSIEENVQAESSQQQQQQNGQATPKNKAPLPNGGNSNDSSVVRQDQTSVAHEDTDMADIIKAAMRENGLNV